MTKQFNNGVLCITHYKGKILKGNTNEEGYIRVHVSKDGKPFVLLVHRIVAEVFCTNPNSHNVVNHLDNNPSNNCATNLEWTTYQGNMQWASMQGRMHYKPENLRKAQKAHERPVIATDKNGKDYYFSSQREAADSLGIKCSRGHIAACCRKEYGYKTAGGYTWRYA